MAHVQIVRVTVDAHEVELACDAMWMAGPSAVSMCDNPDGTVTITADPANPALLEGRWNVEVVNVDPDADRDAWRSWAVPENAGERFVLVPSWVDQPGIDAARQPVLIDPEHSFGSGSHPTTRQCVAALETVVRAGDTVIDAGCGSGVLSVVAALLGAEHVTAFDPATEAIRATRANAERNGVEARITCVQAALGDDALSQLGAAHVVVANIGVRVLTDQAQALQAMVAPGGVLIVSGVFTDQVASVTTSLAACTIERTWTDDGWTTAALRFLPQPTVS